MVGNSRWTKWWWLRMDQIADWSADERRAFVAFTLTWIGKATLFASLGWGILLGLQVLSPGSSLLFSWLVALSGSLFGLRALTTQLFRDTVMTGDDAAATRLGGRVYLPTNESWIGSSWFLDKSIGITEAQREAQRRMALIFLVILLLTFLPSTYLLMAFGASEGLALLIVLLTILPADLYAARRVSIFVWPDLIKKADDDAIARENEINPPRT
jgi:hypothetical protein